MGFKLTNMSLNLDENMSSIGNNALIMYYEKYKVQIVAAENVNQFNDIKDLRLYLCYNFITQVEKLKRTLENDPSGGNLTKHFVLPCEYFIYKENINNPSNDAIWLGYTVRNIQGKQLSDCIDEWQHDAFKKPVLDQLYEALSFLKGNGFSHSDVKPDNIMIDNSNTLKLIDFELLNEKRGASRAKILTNTRTRKQCPEVEDNGRNLDANIYTTMCLNFITEKMNSLVSMKQSIQNILQVKGGRKPRKSKTRQLRKDSKAKKSTNANDKTFFGFLFIFFTVIFP